ncbi:hypothetical protein [Caudoviricetes sp.]|nr:hypothetical protein [Caudoviricetes sp.]UOF79145.1 hypothetical protein [Caudoviricetes sp.]
MGVLETIAVITGIAGVLQGKKNASAAEAAAKAAANSNQTTEEIKHLSPVESMAMGVQGFIGAMEWKQMREQMDRDFFYSQASASMTGRGPGLSNPLPTDMSTRYNPGNTIQAKDGNTYQIVGREDEVKNTKGLVKMLGFNGEILYVKRVNGGSAK